MLPITSDDVDCRQDVQNEQVKYIHHDWGLFVYTNTQGIV